MPMQSLKIDCKLSPFYLTLDLINNLSSLEPYGTDNTQPIFALYNLTVTNISAIGDGKHLKIDAVKKGKAVHMVKFKTTLDEFPYEVGDNLDFAVKLSKTNLKAENIFQFKLQM